MSWRSIAFLAAFIVGGVVGCDMPIADSGGSRPWGGGGGGYGGYGYPDYDRGYAIEDERAWEREHRHYGCSEVEDRLRYDRSKLSAIDPSKHHKAAQWYQDDIRDAEQDLYACRGEQRRQADWERRQDERRAWERQNDQRADCAKLRNRIATDRAKLSQIDPSKHHKAAEWYQDDLRNAEREMAACR
jgi:hypothetical protein